MTTLIRAGGPRELISYVPFRLGYRPQDSVALVGLRAPRGRIGLVVRVDIADLADLDDGPQVARSVVGHLIADGAERVVLVAYTDAPLREPGVTATRERAAVEHARTACENLLGPADAWVVSSTGWAGLDCVDPVCCPPSGRSLRELESSEVGAHMVLAGAAVADSREESMRIVRATPAARRRAARAARATRDRGVQADQQGTHVGWREDALAAWHDAVARVGKDAPDGRGPDASDLPEPLIGRLEAGLESIPVRDAVLLSLIVPDGALVDETVRCGDVDGATGDAIGRVVDPVHGLPPDPVVIAPARAVLEAVVAHAVRGRGAPAATLLAFAAWWEGDGGRAGERLREALGDDPGYRLALLLSSALDAGVPPGWVRAGR